MLFRSLEAARPLLADAQARICALIRLSPQRGLPWIQLLSMSPEAAQAPHARAELYNLSHDLSRFEMEALRARAVPVAAVVLVGEAHSSNAEAIGRLGGVSVVVTCPALERVTPATVQATAQQLIGWEAVDAWLQ